MTFVMSNVVDPNQYAHLYGTNKLGHFIEEQRLFQPQAEQDFDEGKKTEHFMWCFFPLLKGMGFSEMHRKFDIQCLQHAIEYMQNDTLMNNYFQLTDILYTQLAARGKDLADLCPKGSVDVLKIRSSLTLFSIAIEEILAQRVGMIDQKIEDKRERLRQLKEYNIDKLIELLGGQRCNQVVNSVYLHSTSGSPGKQKH
jgi:uncharacterized protein (DUF1810 family)